jgi:hypothetical protein
VARLRSFSFQITIFNKLEFGLTSAGLILAAFMFVLSSFQPAWASPGNASLWFVDLDRFSMAAHRTLKCERCHSELTVQGKIHPNRDDPQAMKKDPVRLYDYKLCASCHPLAHERYLKGEHAKALEKEKQRPPDSEALPPEKMAPTCGNCHSSHYAQTKRSRIQLGTEMVDVCGNCHKAQKKSYLNDIHGRLGVFLGKTNAAYCTDCHGAHTCESLKDKQRALEACRRCHRDATSEFAAIVIHATPQDLSSRNTEKQQNIAAINTIKRIGKIIAIIVLGFFALQTFLWILRELHRKLRGR